MFDALFMAVMLIPLQTVELLAADICWLNSDGNSIRIWSFVIKFVITTVVKLNPLALAFTIKHQVL